MLKSPTSERRRLALADVTDWYIPENDDSPMLAYPGAVKVQGDGELPRHANRLREAVLWRQGQDAEILRDWRLQYEGLWFRAHRQRTVDGVMYILRRISTNPPSLQELRMPEEITNLVMRQSFGEFGGLVLVCGGPGQGKSTTCASFVQSRVREHGHFCLTVEDPPEFSLHGNYDTADGRVGKIVQVPATGDSFAAELKDALRCYPSQMRGSMLMVGEVRDGDTAAQLLRAAVNGQLVFSTLHASDPIAALSRMLALASQEMGESEASGLLAHSLRAVLTQRLLHRLLKVDVLLSLGPTSSVAAQLRTGNLQSLASEVEQQRTLLNARKLVARISEKQV